MNAYIETLNEILGGIPRDTIHAEQRRAMQYAIDLAAHPSRGVVDVESALQRAYNLGQTYWQQADSEYASDHRKASETAATFRQLVIDTVAALPAVPVAESVTLTVAEIVHLAHFAGLTLAQSPLPSPDELNTEITICECPATGVALDDLDVDSEVAHYAHVAYYSEYPDEGCFGLGPELAATPAHDQPEGSDND